MSRRDNRERTKRWTELLRQVNASLYQVDPERMGSSVGAPQDVYDAAGTSLMSSLDSCKTQAIFAATARQTYPELSNEVIDRWWACQRRLKVDPFPPVEN